MPAFWNVCAPRLRSGTATTTRGDKCGDEQQLTLAGGHIEQPINGSCQRDNRVTVRYNERWQVWWNFPAIIYWGSKQVSLVFRTDFYLSGHMSSLRSVQRMSQQGQRLAQMSEARVSSDEA